MLGLRLLGNFVRSAFERKYGPELVTNGSFDSGTGWTLAGESTISGGVGRVYSSAGAFSGISQAGIMTVSKQYLVEFDVVATNGVNLASNVGGITWQTSTIGHKKQTITAVETALYFKRISGVTDVTLDNVSVKMVL